MKKRILAVIFAGLLASATLIPVFAAEILESTPAGEETESAEEESFGAVINPENYVDVEVIDLSLHVETSGDFSPIYAFGNPFMGKDTQSGAVFEFYAKPTWEVHELGAIFAINGSGEYDGRLYFSPGSYLGFNSTEFGGYYDANLFNYTIVDDYIKDGAKIRIELLPDGFAVYADDMLCYDQTILDDPAKGGGDFTSESDFTPVLKWLSGADTLYFGYGSWWNAVGSNEANINLSQISFRLMDGTVVMDKLQADKELIESLGGRVDGIGQVGSTDTAVIASVDVELFDIHSVEYEGSSVLIPMIVAILAVAALSVAVVVFVTYRRTYDE